MASNRAFKNLASLRDSFDEPLEEDSTPASQLQTQAIDSTARTAVPPYHPSPAPILVRSHDYVQTTSPITGKIDRRRLKKVLKTPSVSLSVAVRAELHEDISTMLFARKSTWIALLDQLLTAYVSEAKTMGQFPK